MRGVLVLLLSLVTLVSTGGRVVESHGVRVVVPSGWHRIAPADAGNVVDPQTLLVVGTSGVAPRSSQCQIAAYGIPPRGAVVVVVGWASATSSGGSLKPGRAPLERLVRVRRPSFECFSGRGAAAQLVLGRKAYQVNVMVGDGASTRLVADALAVARSFRRAH